MVSPELIRRYPFFAGLSTEEIAILSQAAQEMAVDVDHYFFHEGDELDHFYVVVEGKVGILVDVPDPTVRQSVSSQLIGNLITREVVVATVEPGQMFAWSALVFPHRATSSGKALSTCRVISFDCQGLQNSFEENRRFGYLMMLKVTSVIRDRVRAMRLESIGDISTAQKKRNEPALETMSL